MKNVTNVTNVTSVTTAMLKVVNVDRHISPEQSPWETFDDIVVAELFDMRCQSGKVGNLF